MRTAQLRRDKVELRMMMRKMKANLMRAEYSCTCTRLY